uniref:Uncharacterized protein n=1 Tax=Medicago truncatula TaxID=3880 RepID=A2Q2H8_MEDTR|nr:hypothetical protein MtrDRAFT_AC150800g37v2 [Medicago truncatula]
MQPYWGRFRGKEMDNSSCSESDVCTSDEDVEEIYTSLYGCNFDDETAVDCMAYLERINYKEIGSDEIMRYHFPDRLVAYKFYNLYGDLLVEKAVLLKLFVAYRLFVREVKSLYSI